MWITSIVGDCAQDALAYWQSATVLTFALVAADVQPGGVIGASSTEQLNVALGCGARALAPITTTAPGWVS